MRRVEPGAGEGLEGRDREDRARGQVRRPRLVTRQRADVAGCPSPMITESGRTSYLRAAV